MDRNSKNKFKIIAVVILVLVVLFFIKQRAGISTKTQTADIAKSVANIVQVDSSISPRIQMVNDIAPFAGQQFFKSVQVGDAIVFYPNQAVLYRPSTGKIITMGTIDSNVSNQIFNTTTTTANPSTTQNPSTAQTSTTSENAAVTPISFEVRNGTKRTGLAKIYADKIAKIANSTVLGTGNAANKSYEKTVIINTSGSAIGDIEKMFNTTAVTALPTGEAESKAQVIVILGADIPQ